ncbi:MAG: RHS repeat-associated core domain-containing protein [Fimbriimonadaceae bacterium]|jgi:RHS repeat-associated protein|nr:RHS repeat-associated core domain-containing protein [Fimbriimonadaceae bacterium]
MVATLRKNAAGTSWSIGNQRSYDVWGGVRSGSATGGPKQRYCANLGHVQDDESRLIYMRARFYEPGSGRFISEDPIGDGGNWYAYVGNIPTIPNDPDGKAAQAVWMGFLAALTQGLAFFVAAGLTSWVRVLLNNRYRPDGVMKLATDAVVGAIGSFALTLLQDVKAAKYGNLSLTELVKRIHLSLLKTNKGKIGVALMAAGKVGAIVGVYSALLAYFLSPAYSESWGAVFGSNE